MKRMILVVLAACGSPDNDTMLIDGPPSDIVNEGDPLHQVVACDPSWEGNAADCEVACSARPFEPNPPRYDNCKVENPNAGGREDYCFNRIEGTLFLLGIRTRFFEREGCCVKDREANRMVFLSCSPVNPGPGS